MLAKFPRIWPSRTGSHRVAAQQWWQVGRVELEHQPLDRGGARYVANDFLQHLLRVEIEWLQRQTVGLDACHVEQVVDDRQQLLRCIADLVEAQSLRRVARILTQAPGEPDDGVHRRADLMAHVGDEAAAGTVGGLCGIQRAHQVGSAPLHQFFQPRAVIGQLVVVFEQLAVLVRHQHVNVDQGLRQRLMGRIPPGPFGLFESLGRRHARIDRLHLAGEGLVLAEDVIDQPVGEEAEQLAAARGIAAGVILAHLRDRGSETAM